jgi:hypothetical protein
MLITHSCRHGVWFHFPMADAQCDRDQGRPTDGTRFSSDCSVGCVGMDCPVAARYCCMGRPRSLLAADCLMPMRNMVRDSRCCDKFCCEAFLLGPLFHCSARLSARVQCEAVRTWKSQSARDLPELSSLFDLGIATLAEPLTFAPSHFASIRKWTVQISDRGALFLPFGSHSCPQVVIGYLPSHPSPPCLAVTLLSSSPRRQLSVRYEDHFTTSCLSLGESARNKNE